MYIQTNKLFFASLSLCCKHHYPINAFSRVLVKRIILTRLLKPQDVSPNYSGIKKEKCTFYLSLAKKTICPLGWDKDCIDKRNVNLSLPAHLLGISYATLLSIEAGYIENDTQIHYLLLGRKY